MRRFLPAILFLFAANVATAQDNERVYRKMDIDQLQRVLTALKYESKNDKAGCAIKVGGKSVLVEVFLGGKVLVLGNNEFPAVDLERINQWNNEKALSRAILRRTPNCSRLESDLHVELGATPAMIDGFIKRFALSMKEFDDFVGKKENVKPDASAPRGPRSPDVADAKLEARPEPTTTDTRRLRR